MKKYKPPICARRAAKKAIMYRKKYPKEVKAMTPVGWRRASQLASGKSVSSDVVKRMAQFNRHRSNAQINPKFKSTPWKDRGYVAWIGWGGTCGINWAIRKSKEIKRKK